MAGAGTPRANHRVSAVMDDMAQQVLDRLPLAGTTVDYVRLNIDARRGS